MEIRDVSPSAPLWKCQAPWQQSVSKVLVFLFSYHFICDVGKTLMSWCFISLPQDLFLLIAYSAYALLNHPYLMKVSWRKGIFALRKSLLLIVTSWVFLLSAQLDYKLLRSRAVF